MTVNKFQQTMEGARYFDIAERYEDMTKQMKEAVELASETNEELSVATRNSFSLAYKNLLGSRRKSWRILVSEKIKLEESASKDTNIVDGILSVVESELLGYCREVQSIIDKHILKPDVNYSMIHKVFFLKMKGDYYRYMAEILKGDEEAKIADLAHQCYDDAKKISDGNLRLTDPIRLGLYLNFSVFLYEIRGDIPKACQIAKHAFDSAIFELDSLSENYYDDSTLIMQLIRDNLVLWTSEENSNNNNLKEEKETL